MTEPTAPMPLKRTIPPDLQNQVEAIQFKVPRTTGPPGDLDEEKKRWLIVGICLHSIISPLLRKYINPVISDLYNSLVSSNSIDTQGNHRYLKKYPAKNRYPLNYESINNNSSVPKTKKYNKWVNDYQKYDYKVMSHVDLSKLFLQPHMAHYSAIDESCDSSALLGMVINISSFPPDVQTDAEKIRSDIRNTWAHCDFRDWDTEKYKDSLDLMGKLVKDLGMSSIEENRVLEELNTWATNGQHFLSGTRLGLEIVEEIRKQTNVLSKYILTLCETTESERIKLQHGHTELKNLETDLQEHGNRLLILENKTKEYDEEFKKTQHSSLIEQIMKIEAEQKEVIPKSIRDQIKTQIEDWVKKDRIFVSTKASDYVMERLQDNSCVTLTAPSGVGKSFIARHTALILQKEGYNIIPVRKPDDIEDYYQPGKQTVFIVDDICGNFTANQQQIESWKQLLPVINTIIADKYCKIIVSCRLQVYNDDKFNILSPFKSCECNLISDKLCLTSEEKNAIAKTYIGSILDDTDKLSQNSEFFPLLCSLYDIEKNRDVEIFFKNPFNVYQNELDNLNRHGDEGILRICSLALCVIFNNQLEEKWFKGKLTDEQKHIIEDICDACEISRITSKEKLKKALDTLEGTFICKQNGIYRTLHDKLFDFLAHYFGRKMIKCLIDHGDSALVQERFIWQKSLDDKSNNIDFIIEIPDEYLESYLERFIKEWSAGKLAAVFSNSNMEDSSFRQQLLQYLLQLDNSIQVTLANTKDTVIPQGCYGSGNIPLISACYGGYTDMVQWILCNDGVVDQCRNDGVNGLIMASQEGHIDIVRLLLKKNPGVDVCNHKGCSSLLKASQNGQTDIVRLLLESDSVNVNLCDNDACSPLYMASQNGHTNIVKLLLKKNPNVNLCDAIFGCSPLYIVSNNGHADIVKLLLENDSIIVDLCDNDSCSPLFMASHNGHIDVVRLLIENDSDVGLCDKNGNSPLLIASCQGHTNIVKVLLEKDPTVDICNTNGCSPLYMASYNGHIDVVRLLLEKNPYVDQCDKNGNSPLLVASNQGHTNIVNVLLEKDSYVDLCNKDECSPLYMASNNGHTNTVKLLLEKNPNVDLCNTNGCSPLYMASSNGHIDVVRLLLEKNPYVDLCNNDGNSPLSIASAQGHTSIVKELLEKDSNVDICSNKGFTPLINACSKDCISVVQLLIKHKPNINAQSFDGGNALYFSVNNGNVEITKLLLENNAECNICGPSKQTIIDAIKNDPTKTLDTYKRNCFDSLTNIALSSVKDFLNKKSGDYVFNIESGSSPLHIACFMGWKEVVCCLLDHNANIDIAKEDGTTPLFYACEVGHDNIVRLLLDKGADTQICRLDGQYPLQIAKNNEHPSIVMMLKNHTKKDNKLSS